MFGATVILNMKVMVVKIKIYQWEDILTKLNPT